MRKSGQNSGFLAKSRDLPLFSGAKHTLRQQKRLVFPPKSLDSLAIFAVSAGRANCKF